METGLVVLCEIENGVFRLTSASQSLARKSNLKPLGEYLEGQGRFKNLTQMPIKEWQDRINTRWKAYLKRANFESQGQMVRGQAK